MAQEGSGWVVGLRFDGCNDLWVARVKWCGERLGWAGWGRDGMGKGRGGVGLRIGLLAHGIPVVPRKAAVEVSNET